MFIFAKTMKSNSKHILSFLILLYNSFCSFSQNNNKRNVTLIEKQNGKRLELFAKNQDSISYAVFLRVTTNNYRRTSNRPVLTHIKPNSETHLLTLIKLANKPATYESQFIITDVSQKISFRKDFEDFQVNFDQSLKTKKITIYESEHCAFCEETKLLFKDHKIAFTTKQIVKDQKELLKALAASGKSTEHINNETLIIQVKEDIYLGITNKKELVNVLKQYIEH